MIRGTGSRRWRAAGLSLMMAVGAVVVSTDGDGVSAQPIDDVADRAMAPTIEPALTTLTTDRFVDTRPGGGTVDGMYAGTGFQTAGSTLEVGIAGRGGVPSGVDGAIIELTVTGTTGSGFATVHPCETPRPNASALNFVTGVDVANEIFARLNGAGDLCVYVSAETHVLIDVVGYVEAGNTVKLMSPARIAESRVGQSTVDGLFQGFGRTSPGSTTTLVVAGRAGVPHMASAAILNVAAVDPTSDGFISVRPCTPGAPATSSLNHTAGVNRANELIAELDLFGNVCIFTERDVDLIVDVVGYVEDGSELVNKMPDRFVDTRGGATVDGTDQGGGKLAASSTKTIQITGRSDVPNNALAAVVNVAAVDAEAAGFFTVDGCNTPRPNASSLNYTAGVNGANELVVPLNEDGELCVYSSASTHLLVDVVGYLKPLLLDLQLLGFNDYHGHITDDTSGFVSFPARWGGGEYLSAKLNELRDARLSNESLTVAAGDLIGGSPAFSGLFHDEPSVESLNVMEMDISSVGNHEFDEGVTELLRMQDGGCHPVDGCYFPGEPYPGADFQWLSANVVKTADMTTPLPPYKVETIDGVKVGFIGMTLEATDTLVAASGIVGYEFKDEVATANALVPELTGMGVHAIVVLLHEGASQTPPPGDINACVDLTGPILAINDGLDPEIDAMITGHTHLPYNCTLKDSAGEDRLVTSAYSFGRVVTDMNLVLDRTTGDVDRDLSSATNHAVLQDDLTPDPAVTAVIDRWQPLYDVAASEVVGEITADITRGGTPPGSDRGVESAAGNLVADAQLWATSVFASNGAEIAFMNPGGVRSDLEFTASGAEADGEVTFGEAFTFQPFNNTLFTIPMTGAQIEDVLEEQCQPAGSSRPFLHLGVSDGFTYTLDETIVDGDCTAITVSDMKLGGVALVPTTSYKVTVNNFLADGGDNFATFATIDPFLRVDGGIDIDALTGYLGASTPPGVDPPPTDRVTEI